MGGITKISRVLAAGDDNSLLFNCPGCKIWHQIKHGAGNGPRWGWNGDAERPTFTPSVLVTWNEPSDVEEEFDDPSKDREARCHTFVTDGRIQFLSDCTHALAGQTMELPEFDL